MPFQSAEVETLWRHIDRTVEGLVALAESLDAETLNWRAPAPDTNSVAGLAHHTLEHLEDNAVHRVGGAERKSERQREVEFGKTEQTAEAIRARWEATRSRARSLLERLDGSALARETTHPVRGVETGMDVLLVVIGHANEHRAHAELTRDLAAAR
jgi:hypothetical protein